MYSPLHAASCLSSRARPYLETTLLVAAITPVKQMIVQVWAQSPFMLFTLAVVIGSWRGGLPCGLYAVALATTTAAYLFVGDTGFASVLNPGALVALGVFTVQGTIIAIITSRLVATRLALSSSLEKEQRATRELAQALVVVRDLNRRLQLAVTETNHRVKNNLQVVASLLLLQTKGKGLVEAHDIKGLAAQVQGFSALHDLLTKRSQTGELNEVVSSKEVMLRLAQIIGRTLPGTTLYASEDAPITLKQASSLAVIVNELVSNSFKHGARNVGISLNRRDGAFGLVIEDDGRGFSPDFDSLRHSNIGLKLVRELALSDLGAEPVFSSRQSGGARVWIELAALRETNLSAA